MILLSTISHTQRNKYISATGIYNYEAHLYVY